MDKYGQIAVKAAKYIQKGKTPRVAWEIASCEIFEPGSSSQVKGCPRNAFIGLYGGSGKNAEYAQKALAYLKSHPNKYITEFELWGIVMSGEVKAYNHQMDVVLALYREDLI